MVQGEREQNCFYTCDQLHKIKLELHEKELKRDKLLTENRQLEQQAQDLNHEISLVVRKCEKMNSNMDELQHQKDVRMTAIKKA